MGLPEGVDAEGLERFAEVVQSLLLSLSGFGQLAFLILPLFLQESFGGGEPGLARRQGALRIRQLLAGNRKVGLALRALLPQFGQEGVVRVGASGSALSEQPTDDAAQNSADG